MSAPSGARSAETNHPSRSPSRSRESHLNPKHGGEPAQKGDVPRRIGRTKGGLNSKLHTVCDGDGRPIILLLSEGQMSDHKGARLVLDALPAASHLIADRGYDSAWFRAELEARGIHGQPLSVRGRVLQSGLGLGEGTGREERPGCAPPVMAANAALSLAGGLERLAGTAVSGAVATDSPWPQAGNDRRHPGRGSAVPDADRHQEPRFLGPDVFDRSRPEAMGNLLPQRPTPLFQPVVQGLQRWKARHWLP
ncbi:transposase [Mesorhizobium composti]|uniref:Transposase n=1 Tax=Ollibium composti TaxID=2675109 RepID=A0ABY2Q0P5_9HYPH|nr:transposase [Mesorhizobium composti]